jgi:ATP-dependent protease HslVU (ClpYQ) peptidase subunit
MTCIVGIVNNDIVYIGGDRGISNNDNILSLCRPKVMKNGDYIIGYAGSQGVGQLAHIMVPPACGKDVEKTLRTTFIKSLKTIIEEFGPSNLTESETHTDFLVGCKGRLFEISTNDWSVSELEYSAVGSGANIALGSLYTSSLYTYTPIERITYALNAAITLSPTCQGPVDIIYL